MLPRNSSPSLRQGRAPVASRWPYTCTACALTDIIAMHLETSADHAGTKKVRGLLGQCRPAILARFPSVVSSLFFFLHRIPANVELLELSFRPVNLNEILRYHCYSFQMGKDKTKEDRGDTVTDGPFRAYCSYPNGYPNGFAWRALPSGRAVCSCEVDW